jgi:hypothetical protein
MPKKEKVWTMGNKGPTGPWVWHVWIKGSKKPVRVVAFNIEHIKDQLEGKTVIKAVKQPEEKDEFSSVPLGPKGSTVNRPPEEIRVKLRELYIDYDVIPKKTTRYSARKKKRHKI